MNRHKTHQDPEIESVVRITWCEECFGWHCKRRWVLWPTEQSYAPWISHTDELFVPGDEWADKNMLKWSMGAAQTTKLLEQAARSGQDPLTV